MVRRIAAIRKRDKVPTWGGAQAESRFHGTDTGTGAKEKNAICRPHASSTNCNEALLLERREGGKMLLRRSRDPNEHAQRKEIRRRRKPYGTSVESPGIPPKSIGIC